MNRDFYKQLALLISEETNVKDIVWKIGDTEQGKLSLVYLKDKNDFFFDINGEYRKISDGLLLKLAKDLFE